VPGEHLWFPYNHLDSKETFSKLSNKTEEDIYYIWGLFEPILCVPVSEKIEKRK